MRLFINPVLKYEIIFFQFSDLSEADNGFVDSDILDLSGITMINRLLELKSKIDFDWEVFFFFFVVYMKCIGSCSHT